MLPPKQIGNVDPFVAALAVSLGGRDPAAVLLAEIARDVGHVDALLREQMRQREQAPEQVRPRAGVGRHRGLRRNVLERFARDIDLDAGRLGEGVEQRHEGSSSDCTKYFQRSSESCALRSGLPGRGLGPGLRPFAEPDMSAPVAASAVPPCTRVRRVSMVMVASSLVTLAVVFRSARRTDARTADRA